MSALIDIKQYLSLVPANVPDRGKSSKSKYVEMILEKSLGSINLEKNYEPSYLYECLNTVRTFLLDFAGNNLERYRGWFKAGRINLKQIVIDKFGDDENLSTFIYDTLNLDTDEWKVIKDEKREVINNSEDLDLDYEEYLKTTDTLLKSSDWREVYAGLVACLGRRPTEYLDSKAFNLVDTEDGYDLFFNNQLKKKNAQIVSYSIPTLFANTQDIYDVWVRFINNEEVVSMINDCKNKLSDSNLDDDAYIVKYNEILKEKFNHIPNQVIKKYFAWLPYPQRFTEVSCRVLRHIYGTLATSMCNDITSMKKTESFFCYVLGHEVGNNEVTRAYKDYKLIPNIRNLIVEFKKPEIIKQLEEVVSVSTIERLKRVSKDKNIDMDTLLNMCLEKLESEDTLLDISTNLEEVKGIQTPYSARQKIYLAYKKIIAHNDNLATIPNNRYAITVRALQDLSGSRHSAIKSFLDEYQDDINAHHNKYDLGTYSNKGKQDINKIIQ